MTLLCEIPGVCPCLHEKRSFLYLIIHEDEGSRFSRKLHTNMRFRVPSTVKANPSAAAWLPEMVALTGSFDSPEKRRLRSIRHVVFCLRFRSESK